MCSIWNLGDSQLAIQELCYWRDLELCLWQTANGNFHHMTKFYLNSPSSVHHIYTKINISTTFSSLRIILVSFLSAQFLFLIIFQLKSDIKICHLPVNLILNLSIIYRGLKHDQQDQEVAVWDQFMSNKNPFIFVHGNEG